MISPTSVTKTLPAAQSTLPIKTMIDAPPVVTSAPIASTIVTTLPVVVPSPSTLIAQPNINMVPVTAEPVKAEPVKPEPPKTPSNPLNLLQTLVPPKGVNVLELTKLLTIDEMKTLAAVMANPNSVKTMSVKDFKALVAIMMKLPPSYFLPSDQKQFLDAIGPIQAKLKSIAFKDLNSPEAKALLAQVDTLLGKITNDAKAVDASIKAMKEAFAKATTSDERERLRGLISQAEDLKARLAQSRDVLRNLLQASRGGAGEWEDAKQRLTEYINDLNATGTSNQNMLKVAAGVDGAYNYPGTDPRLALWKKLMQNQFVDSFLGGQVPVVTAR